MECTTTREKRAERWRSRNVLAATAIAISTFQVLSSASVFAQAANPPPKPIIKKHVADKTAKPADPAAIETTTADQLNAKWLAEHAQGAIAQPNASSTNAATASAPTTPVAPTMAGEEDKFAPTTNKLPVANGARALIPGSVTLVRATSASAINTMPGGSSLASYTEVARAFSGFAPNGTKVEMVKGETADGATRLLLASIGEGKSRLSYWWFAPPDQPEGWFDDSGHRVGGTMLADPKPDSRISSPFGTRRYYGRTTGTAFHNGIDFEGKVGEPILAAADGVINHMGWYYNYGRTVKITHADNFETLYAHMSRFSSGMGPGTVVHKGEVIGYVGSTGRSTGPHLHFSAILNGQFVDPEPYLSENGNGRLDSQDLVAFRQWQQDLRLAADPKKAKVTTAASAPRTQPPAANDTWSQSPFAPKGNPVLGHL